MKLRCPVCNMKMQNNICPNCKDVTTTRVINASNALAKEKLKAGDVNQEVVYSTVFPKDLNHKKMFFYVLFLTLFGVPDFYVGKKIKAWFHVLSFSVSVLVVMFAELSVMFGWGVEGALYSALGLPAMALVFALIIWFRDITNFLFKKYKYPVVLAKN